jgi:predicted dehydrogenase
MSARKRYAIVGLGGRSSMYTSAILGERSGSAELVGLCDVNSTRMRVYNELFARQFDAPAVATYHPNDFSRMLRERYVEVVIVTSVDRTHHRYIVEALRAGCDVITEKPLTIDASRCQAIVDAVKETGRQVRVCFNYRYAARNARVKELLDQRVIGDITSVHFEWLLDTRHGADYFRRWHRDKRNSGGLMIHKASHHFDLVNWWLGARPEAVFGFGRLAFYGRDNAETRGVTRFYDRATGSEAAREDPFALDLQSDPRLKALYLDAEHEDGYLRDQSVFSDGISIEDDMAAIVRYSTGATLTYHLTTYSPWEGYRIGFNGTEGRLELEAIERTHVDPSRNAPTDTGASERITVQRLWQRAQQDPFDAEDGTHAGADAKLLEDLFGGAGGTDTLGRASTHLDGVFAILPGVGANISFASGLPVDLTRLVQL